MQAVERLDCDRRGVSCREALHRRGQSTKFSAKLLPCPCHVRCDVGSFHRLDARKAPKRYCRHLPLMVTGGMSREHSRVLPSLPRCLPGGRSIVQDDSCWRDELHPVLCSSSQEGPLPLPRTVLPRMNYDAVKVIRRNILDTLMRWHWLRHHHNECFYQDRPLLVRQDRVQAEG